MNLLAFDLETSGELPEYALQPWRVAQGKAWITTWATASHSQQKAKKGKIFTAGDIGADHLRTVLEYAIKNDHRIVTWNGTFDIAWLLAYGLEDLVFKCKWLDGMLLYRHWFIEPEYDLNRANKKSYGLKPAVTKFLPDMAGYEKDIDFHNPDPTVRAELLEYNKKDCIATLRLAEHFWGLLEPKQRRAALIEADCLPMVAQANLRGMMVDTLFAEELRANLKAKATEMLEILAPYGVTEKIVRSPLQLSKLMFDAWGLKVLKENTSKLTGKVSRSTDKEVLHELSFEDGRAAHLRSYREALGNCTKFADTPIESAQYNGDGRAHPSAIPFGTYSGRLTYSSKQGKNKDERQTGFAIHQEKRGAEFRGVIQAPSGYTLMEFDASGQEFRWMAIAAEDKTMLDLCAPGQDAHSFMGAAAAERDYREVVELCRVGDEVAKNIRQLGKVANLSLQYRTGARKLRTTARLPPYEIPMELPEAQLIHRTYQRTYTRVPTYWGEQIRQTRLTGYVETFAGRRVQVTGNWDGEMGWSMGSTAINYRIQGTGADQKYLALSVIKPYLVSIGAHFAWDLHDGIYLYVPDKKVQRAAHDIKHLLDNLPYERAWGFKPPIALPWDTKAGPSWGTLKEWKQ